MTRSLKVLSGVQIARGCERTWYAQGEDFALFAPLRFIWNATRGHRLAPWRSEFLRWRVETYSGKPAETLKARDILGFMWSSRWELLSFLAWTGDLDREARKRV